MPSFLTTKKMGPRLRERIQTSLSGRRTSKRRSRTGLLFVACLRAALLVALVVVAVNYLLEKRGQESKIEALRAELLRVHQGESADLGKTEKEVRLRAESAVAQALGEYEGDLVAGEAKDVELFSALLAKQGIYLRGRLKDFKAEGGLSRVASHSLKDGFLVCLLDPPAGIEEKALLERTYVAYRSGPALDSATPGYFRLQAALAFMPLLEDSWRDNVKRVQKLESLEHLMKTLKQAPLEQAKAAARAEYFLFLIDEEKQAGAASEFDGASKHFVRIHLVHLASQDTILRQRLLVDPSWISERSRHRYAQGLLACRLARELRDQLFVEKTLVPQTAPLADKTPKTSKEGAGSKSK